VRSTWDRVVQGRLVHGRTQALARGRDAGADGGQVDRVAGRLAPHVVANELDQEGIPAGRRAGLGQGAVVDRAAHVVDGGPQRLADRFERHVREGEAGRPAQEGDDVLADSGPLDRLYRCLTGSVAVSAYELAALPLPSPDVLAKRAGLDADAFEAAVAETYGGQA
jgi:hypothetical protein